jgi:DNA-binding transcriptional ArsR family regulator
MGYSDMPEREETSLTPEEAFRTLGNETRLDILQALAEALRAGEQAVSFTDLRERAGLSDTGNLDYHLDQLRGTFIRETELGYALRLRGLEIIGTVFAGTLTDHRHEADVASGECLFCDAALTVEYADGALVVRCTRGHAVMANLFPPGGAEDRDVDELVGVIDRMTRQQLELAAESVCSNCYGRMTPVVEEGELIEYRFRATCERCGMAYTTTVGMVLARHPAVAAFYHDHGRDITAIRLWRLALAQPDAVERVSTSPARFLVRVVLDDEMLEITVDGTGKAVETERREVADE